jgi:type IV secretory pathway TrbD component
MTLSAAQLIPINWVDGLLAGFLVVSLQHWLVRLYSLPDDLVWVIGIANLTYGCV